MNTQLTLPGIPPVYKPRASLPKGFSVYKTEDTIECMVERISKLIFKPNVGGDIVLQSMSMKGGYKILHTPMGNLTDKTKLTQLCGPLIVVHTTSRVYLGYMVDETGQAIRY